MASDRSTNSRIYLPSVDRLLRHRDASELITEFGRSGVTAAIRHVLAELRAKLGTTSRSIDLTENAIIDCVSNRLAKECRPSLRAVLNLTGTVIHTNLGRASLPVEAIEAVSIVAGHASNLEYDLGEGRRGDRDDHIEEQLCRLTGAQAATIVNNNAAAVLLTLNSLAFGKEVLVSRGELIEIGGSFRMPDIMKCSGCRLHEVGTTNRTHLGDYEEAIGPKTALVMKVHTSNYAIVGFTVAVLESDLARVCHDQGLPFAVDLGSGILVDLRKFGVPHEPTPMEALKHGADIVTFSGDKLLGGPQAGIIVGRAELVKKIKRNPLKRALRVDKMTIAALSAVLKLYLDPDCLTEHLPALRAMARPVEKIREVAERLYPLVVEQLDQLASVEIVDCDSQIGSGALPTKHIASAGLAIRPVTRGRGAGTALRKLAQAFRALPIPVIGRIQDDAFILDLRCLEDERVFGTQLPQLRFHGLVTE